MSVGCVCVRAKPARDHSHYAEWETAKVVILVLANDELTAATKAREALRRDKWELLGIDRCYQLAEDLVRQHGGEVWDLYERAQSTGVAIQVFPDHFAAGPSRAPAMRPPRVTESFMDVVVQDVGGQRLPASNEQRVADYRIGDWIFELKDLQNDGLLELQRQAKLAKLFAPYVTPGHPLPLDPDVLSPEERRLYADIVGGPIQTAVKSASKQIRSTKTLPGFNNCRGGLIYLNTGYGSLPSDTFGALVERYVKKDTTQIDTVFCASTWCLTNGFDTETFFLLHPSASEHGVVNDLQNAFATRFEEAMTQVVTGLIPQGVSLAAPLSPVAFTCGGLEFSWEPAQLPFSWEDDEGRT